MAKRTKKATPKKGPKGMARAFGKVAAKATKKILKQAKKAKPKVYATVKEEFYRVDTEVPMSNQRTGETTFTYTTGSEVTDEQTAHIRMEGLKMCGIGGRLVHLDGTPDGKIISVWGNVDRMAAAERREREVLESKNK